jgi:hypothetical protein
MDQLGNILQPLVGDRDNTHIRLNRTEAVACHFCPCRSQGVKDRRFPNIWKPDNPTPKTHPLPFEVRNLNFEFLNKPEMKMARFTDKDRISV